jgi:hypothetical protein
LEVLGKVFELSTTSHQSKRNTLGEGKKKNRGSRGRGKRRRGRRRGEGRRSRHAVDQTFLPELKLYC